MSITVPPNQAQDTIRRRGCYIKAVVYLNKGKQSTLKRDGSNMKEGNVNRFH